MKVQGIDSFFSVRSTTPPGWALAWRIAYSISCEDYAMFHDDVTGEIFNYLRSDPEQPHFAICLYGGWGTGKTHYCCGELALKLSENLGFNLVRVSLFGVGDIAGLNQRLLAAILKLSGDMETSTVKIDLAKSAYSSVSGVFKKLGLSVSLSPETVLSLIPMDKTLIVLDDAERCQIPEEELYGEINEMTENRHWFVMVVRNAPVRFRNEDGVSESEKAILKNICFKPCVEELFDSLLASYIDTNIASGFDYRRSIIKGLREVGDIDARSLLRLAPLLQKAIRLNVFEDETVDSSGRSNALSDFVRIACKVASGNAPVPLDANSSAPTNLAQRNEFERYQNLLVVVGPLEEARIADSETIVDCIKEYIDRFYPSSPSDAQMKNLYERYKDWALYDDDLLIDIAAELKECLSVHDFGATGSVGKVGVRALLAPVSRSGTS